MRMDGWTRLSGLLAAGVLVLSVAGCGGSDDGDGGDAETWNGSVQTDLGGEVQIGEFEDSPAVVGVKCSAEGDGPVTATLTGGEFTAVTTQPKDGGTAKVTVKGPDDREVVWDDQGVVNTVTGDDAQDPDPENALTWTPGKPQFTSGSLDEYPSEHGTYKFDLNGLLVDCAKSG